MNAATILLLVDLIDLARLAVTHGAETVQKFEAHRDAVRIMISEQRDPTEEEQKALAKEIEGLRRRLHKS